MNNLRISINAKRFEKAYGGANQAANTLENYLRNKGHKIFRSLKPNLDLIIIFSPKCNLKITSYNFTDISDYIKAYPNTLIINRVNSCDEQRGSDLGINSSMIKYNQLADFSVYISQFIQDIYTAKGMISKQSQVILNGADRNIFYPGKPINKLKEKEKIKIVTHHWSSNFMKGFDIYERFDQLLDIEPFNKMFQFTCIGNIPLGVRFKNTNVIKPLARLELAEELRQHHVYLTAARNEAAGMHHIEGMLCGLPILFLNSGALPEYCSSYGIEFTLIDFEEKLLEIKNQYHNLHEKVLNCNHTSELMVKHFENVIMTCVEKRRLFPRKKNKLNQILLYRFIKKPYRSAIGIMKKACNYLQHF